LSEGFLICDMIFHCLLLCLVVGEGFVVAGRHRHGTGIILRLFYQDLVSPAYGCVGVWWVGFSMLKE